MNKVFDEYISYLEKIGQSPNTITSYSTTIRKFIAYFGIVGYDDLNNLSSADIDSFLEHLNHTARKGSLSKSSENAHIRILKSFNNTLINSDRFDTTHDFTSNVSKRNAGKNKPPKFYSEYELGLFKCAAKMYPKGHRIPLMFDLFLNTGMRLCELLSLQMNQISPHLDEDGWYDLRFTGKGAKTRTVFISAELRDRVVDYVEKHPKHSAIYIFGTNSGRMINPSNFSKDFKTLKERAGIVDINNESRLVHTLRKTYAKQMYNTGYTIEEIQVLLGHEDIKVTQIYFKSNIDSIKQKRRRLAQNNVA